MNLHKLEMQNTLKYKVNYYEYWDLQNWIWGGDMNKQTRVKIECQVVI
jgi:hypothetical protein